MAESKLDLLRGTLDLMVLQTLVTMGSMHGYGIARRIEQVSGDEILLNQGAAFRWCGCSGEGDGLPRSGAPPITTARRSTTRLPGAAASSWPKMHHTGTDCRG